MTQTFPVLDTVGVKQLVIRFFDSKNIPEGIIEPGTIEIWKFYMVDGHPLVRVIFMPESDMMMIKGRKDSKGKKMSIKGKQDLFEFFRRWVLRGLFENIKIVLTQADIKARKGTKFEKDLTITVLYMKNQPIEENNQYYGGQELPRGNQDLTTVEKPYIPAILNEELIVKEDEA